MHKTFFLFKDRLIWKILASLLEIFLYTYAFVLSCSVWKQFFYNNYITVCQVLKILFIL